MAWIPAAIAAGGSILGGMAGGSNGPGHSNDWVNPYTAPTGAAVTSLMGNVASAPQAQYFNGSTIAGMNPYLTNAIGAGAGWGAGQGGMAMNNTFAAGNQAIGGYGQGMDMMSRLQSQPGGPFQFSQATYDQTMRNLMPAMQGSYDAATRDNNRQLNWSTLPGLNMDAAGTGQFGSTKVGQGTALAQGMTADRNADIGASMYQNAVNQAQQAGMRAGNYNLDANMGMVDAYGNYGNSGGTLLNQGYNMGIGNINAGISAGQLQQGYNQSVLSDDVARWNYDQNLPFTDAAMRMDLFNNERVRQRGGASGGGGGAVAGAVQGLQAGLGLYGMGQDAGWWGSGAGTNSYVPTPTFNAQPIGYNQPEYNLGIPGYSTGY